MIKFLSQFLLSITPFVSLIQTLRAEISLDEYFPTALQEVYSYKDIGFENYRRLGQLPDGRLYLQSVNGEIFIFNGNQWKKSDLQFPKLVSRTFVDSNGIMWIATIDSFGYLNNAYQFVSLHKNKNDHDHNIGLAIHEICETKNWIHLISGQKIHHINRKNLTIKITEYYQQFSGISWQRDKKLYLFSSKEKEIKIWEKNQFIHYKKWGHTESPLYNWSHDSIDYFLTRNGVLAYQNGKLIKNINHKRNIHSNSNLISIKDYIYSLGTNSFCRISLEGILEPYIAPWDNMDITRKSSMDLLYFGGDDAWVVGVNSIVRLNFIDKIKKIDIESGYPTPLNTDIESYNDQIYISNYGGFQKIVSGTRKLTIPDTAPFFHTISIWKQFEKLFISTFAELGSYDQSYKIEREPETFTIFAKSKTHNTFWSVGFDNIYLFDDKFNCLLKIPNSIDHITSIVEHNQSLWATNFKSHLYEIDLSDSNGIKEHRILPSNQILDSTTPLLKVLKMDKNLFVLSPKKLFKIQDAQIVEYNFPILKGWSWEIPEYSNEQDSIILAQRNDRDGGLKVGELTVTPSGELNWKPKFIPIITNKGTLLKIKRLDGFSENVVAIINNPSVRLIKLDEFPETLPPPKSPEFVKPIHELANEQPGVMDSVYRYDPLQPLTVQLHYPEFSLEKPIKFAGRLKGSGRDLEFNQNGTFTYPGIIRGTYVFEGFTVDPFGNESEVVRHEIRVIPPWYISNASIGGYVITLGLIIFFSVQVRTRQLRKRSKELEETVEERTKDLMLANQAKSIFVSNVSHEIRNPLNGLLGLAQNLNEGDMIDKGTLQRLRRPSFYLYRFLSNVLDFSKFETGGIRLNKRVFDPNELLDSVESMFAGDFQERNLTFVADYRYENDPFLCASQEAIEMMLVNLVGNAVKFTPPGGNIRTAMQYSEGWLTLTVADSGIGISDDVKERIFEPYEQGDQGPLVTGEKGAGIGLSLVKQTADQLGGYVEVTSEIGKGSTFTASIPVSRSEQSEIPGVVDEVKLKGNFLLVEDLEYNLKLLTDTLTRWGAVVDGVSNGQEALQKIQSTNYDMAILDYDLPDMNGSQVAEEIRKSRLNTKIPIIGLSAYTDQEFIRKALDGGMNDFQFKPVNVQKLVECIHKFIPDQIQFTLKKKIISENGRTSLRTIKRSGPGGSESLETSAQAYLDQLDKLVESLNKSDLGSKNFETILHQLKGHSNLIHHRTSSQYWQRLSEASKAGERMNALEELESLQEIVEAIKKQIESLLLLEADFESQSQKRESFNYGSLSYTKESVKY